MTDISNRRSAETGVDGDDREPPTGEFLAELPAALRNALSRDATTADYKKGSRILPGGSSPRPGIVVEGLVRAYVVAADGREATVKYLRQGEAIGIGWPFLADSPCSLQALEATTILYFDSQQFEAALVNEVALARMVAQSLARGLVRSSDAVREFAFGRVRQRVATHLILLARRDPHGRLIAQVTNQGLAEAVGSVRDVVARTMAELSSAGLVINSRGKVLITDEEALRHTAALT